MGEQKRLTDRMPIKLNLEGETVYKSLIEILGNSRVIIEKHNGIVAYENHKICVKTSAGNIVIHGNGLVLEKMQKEQLVITGLVNSVSLDNWRK